MNKNLLFIPTVFIAVCGYAQTECNSSNPLFRTDNAAMPKKIEKLGSAPEFPFLQTMKTTKQVASAIRKNDERNTNGASEFNELMMAIGFTNGAKDVSESNISMTYLPYGTEGNMGSANYKTSYSKLNTASGGTKAWKISSGTGCYVYVLAKCGNAFYPGNKKRTACISNVPVELNGDLKEVTINNTGQKTTTTDNVYVYYEKKRHKKHDVQYAVAEIKDPYPSRPLLLGTTSDLDLVPETYKVSVNTPNTTVNVCPDARLSITANISVEKTSQYTGYYPSKSKNEYKKVSKRTYKMAARKMRKARRKEARVARKTGVRVSNCAVVSR